MFFKCFQVFHTYVCKCFIWMLYIFAMVFKCFSGIFASVSSIFFLILQLLYLDVSKVDRVLHIGCTWESISGMGDVQRGTGPLLVHSASPMR
jgi:hypothetical protein